MPLYIPWLTETIKKRGVRYLLHHYLGQFFEEKLTLEQLSIDIYEGKGSIKNLALDVNGLNDELDFIPFKFLDGCSIGQISVEVPWSSLATEACKVELEAAKFICRLKTSADGSKAHCTESTLLSRSLMTSSMQMAEDIVTTEDVDDNDSPTSSVYRSQHSHESIHSKRKDANQMFEGLEMFAQLIDSVLRRTKLTAHNTLFQIQPHPECTEEEKEDEGDQQPKLSMSTDSCNSAMNDTGESAAKLNNLGESKNSSANTVEFLIKFFRCEEIIDQNRTDPDVKPKSDASYEENVRQIPSSAMPETVTKLLTLEDVEMRIGGLPVSNLIGRHKIMIKFNGQKSEISIFSGSPLLAVIGHEQLETFFNVFDTTKYPDHESSPIGEKNQKVMSPEDYTKIENQLLESASLRTAHLNDYMYGSNHLSSQSRRWVGSGDLCSNVCRQRDTIDYDYHSPNSSSTATCLDGAVSEAEPSLDNIEAFSCELKLPGIWLCILKDEEHLPPLIKPYADSINSFQTINKYIDKHIKVPHIRLLALKVALDITSGGINMFLGDLDISEHLQGDLMSPTLHLLQSDSTTFAMNASRYKASIMNNREIHLDLLTKTRITFDPTIIDRMVQDYKLVKLDRPKPEEDHTIKQSSLNLNLTMKGEKFRVELLCPIPDLTPEAQTKPTQLRPQSFLFDFKNIQLTWQSDKLNISAKELTAFVKTQPQQSDQEAVKFIEATSKNNDRIVLISEPAPSKLDTTFPNDVEQALNESSLFDSIYVGQATESNLPAEAFQTKRKVVRSCLQSQSKKREPTVINECDKEKILTPGDRQHLLDYLNQTVMATKFSLSLHLPICEVEFEDKEQLDLIYNRFGNDFVFWQPKAFANNRAKNGPKRPEEDPDESSPDRFKHSYFKQPFDDDGDDSPESSDRDSEVSFHSFNIDRSNFDYYDNEATCKITVSELFVKFNHQSCAAALKQEICAENLLLGVVVDINKKPNTIISFVADNLELSTDSNTVVEGNCFGDKNSIFSLTAEIKRPTRALKDIKLAVQLVNGLFNDIKTETYTRFWQSINVTDEPIQGYIVPKIVIELHIDILSTSLLMVRDGVRPALLSIDELYLTSMVMEQTSQVMIRLIADEVSLYLKRNKKEMDIMKNYICLIDSGLIDLDVKFSQDGRLEFGVINNVITVRACQDSLSALCKIFNVVMKNQENRAENINTNPSTSPSIIDDKEKISEQISTNSLSQDHLNERASGERIERSFGAHDQGQQEREMNLLEDAMNDYSEASDYLDESSSGSEDSDDPPAMQTTSEHQSKPHTCILDESNPLIGDLFSQPLVPSPEKMNESGESFSSTNKAVDESGFFIIGDDDVGAGIMGKMQQEPVIRKLVEGPITIVENHFKMTKPRTIPEMLASSLERYVLEEMTLIVNLYGGRDFDDESSDDNSSTNATNDDPDAEFLDAPSESGSMRSRTGSVASSKKSPSHRKHCSSDSTNSLKKKSNRKKHFSEGSKDISRDTIEHRVRFGEGAVNLWESLDLMSSPDFLGARRPSQPPLSTDTKVAGGTWRQTDVCIQLTLAKVKLLYEVADSSSPISWRFMLFIHDIEIKDRIHASDINKLLYEYCTESMPKRNTQILTIKNIATINPSDGCEECDLRVSLKPLRLNIDQDTLLFMIEFFTSFSKSLTKYQSVYGNSTNRRTSCSSSKPESQSTGLRDSSSTSAASRTGSSCSSQDRRRQRGGGQCSEEIDIRQRQTSERSDTTSASYGSSSSAGSSSCSALNRSQPTANAANAANTTTSTTQTFNNEATLHTHCHTDNLSGSNSQPSIYIKSFLFSPDVPIRLDYHAKHVDFEQGALAGILMGLAHLDHSELVLRRVQAKHGMRGLDRVVLFTLNSWLSDIKRNQLPSILSGVGPMHSVIQLFQGMRDLIWMPIDHYRKDRRLVRGLQRGASSFSSSTAMAAINLVNRFISIVQCTAQIAHDIVTPPTQHSSSRRDVYKQDQAGARTGSRRHAGPSNDGSSIVTLNQPRNFCEGVAVGFTILKESFNDTARNVAVGMQADDVRSAVGELVRQIPSTLLNPIISATEGAQNVLVGIRNQITPDARREDQEKWKRRVRGR